MKTFLVEWMDKPTAKKSEPGGWIMKSAYVQAENELLVRVKYPTAVAIKEVAVVNLG